MAVTAVNCLLLACLGGAALAASNETDFAYVTRMPAVEGTLQQSVDSVDPGSGLAIRKRVYVDEQDGFERHTHVIDAVCGNLADDGRPTIVAFQYFPKNPPSFSIAAMPDLYLEVFARDEDQRIRAYRELSGRQMVQLTERFLPICRNL